MEQDEPQFEFYDIEVKEDQEFESDEALDVDPEGRTLKVRLDKWLWAARFFKTRALARAAVENGKVYYNGERSKPSREIDVDAVLQIRVGRYEKTVIVKGLSTRRRSTDEALQLFEETEDSRVARESTPDYQSIPIGQPMPYGASHHNTRFQEQSAHPFPASTESTPKRRAVRFLRRSFVRGNDTQPSDFRTTHPSSQHNCDQRTFNAPQFNQQNRSRTNGHTPYNRQHRDHHTQPHYHSGNYNGHAKHRNDYKQDQYHSGHSHNANRQPNHHYLAPPPHANQNPYPQTQNHGHYAHYSKHQPHHHYNYYGPQSYKEANGNIGHLPFREKETEFEESSD